MTHNRKPDPIHCEMGDVVSWDSQAKGSWVEKRGIVVHVLTDESKETPVDIARRLFSNCVRMFDGLNLPAGAKRAYLIRVPHGRRAKARLHMPYPRALRMEKKCNE